MRTGIRIGVILGAGASATGTSRAQLPDVLWQADHGADVLSVQFSSSGRLVASGGYGGDSSARLWDASDGSVLRTFPGHEHGVVSVAISPDDRLLAVGYIRVDFYNGLAKTNVYDIDTGQQVYEFGGALTTFSADGNRIACAGGGFNRYVDVYELPSATRLAHIYTGNYIWDIALSPDDELIVTGGWDPDAVLWDIATGLEVRRLAGHEGGVGAVALSADGTLVATGVSETDPPARIRIWRVADGQLLHTLNGHDDGVVNDLVFSPDGQTLLSTGRDVRVGGDHSVRLWRISDGQEIARYPFGQSSYGVNGADYSDDGSFVVIGLGNGAVIAAQSPRVGCAADLNNDGLLNSQDFVLFLNLFTTGDPGADFNGDGTIDSQDFIAFLNAFVTGC